jgi:hypothetical protein
MQKDCSLHSRNRRDGPKEPYRIEFASICSEEAGPRPKCDEQY